MILLLFLPKIKILKIEKSNTISISKFISRSQLLVNIHVAELKIWVRINIIGQPNKKTILVEKIEKRFGKDLKGMKFALWGLAFKPNTDDIREAPALTIIDALTAAGATVTAYDPEAMPNVKGQIGDKINYAENQY